MSGDTASTGHAGQPRRGRPLRIGVIGAGVMGTKHLAHLSRHDGVTIHSIADLRDDLLATAASAYPVATGYHTGEELIRDPEVEAVVLALPAKPRFPLACQALEAGKHLFIEKPVARNLAEVDELRALARPAQVVAVASSRFTFLPSFAAVRSVLGGAGPIYQIAHAGIKATPPTPQAVSPDWRLSFDLNGGGIMSNWGCYDLDYLLALLGWNERVTEVSAAWRLVAPALGDWVAPGSDAETHVSAYLRLSGGGVIMLDRGEYLPVPDGWNATMIMGEGFSVSCSIMADAEAAFRFTRHTPSGPDSRVFWEEADDPADLHRPVIHDFADAILDGRAPATTLEQARHIQQVTDAIYASAREQRSIRL